MRSFQRAGRGVFLSVCAVLAGAVPALAMPETDTTQFDHLAVVSQAPGIPSESIYAGFENNESVSLYNGNLLVRHPSTPAFPLDAGGTLALTRSYNSKNVSKDKVKNYQQPFEPQFYSYITGQSYLGLGWTQHLGRIGRQARDRQTGDYWGRNYIFEDSDGTLVEFGRPHTDRALRIEYFRQNSGEPCFRPGTCPQYCSETPPPNDPYCQSCATSGADPGTCAIDASSPAHYRVTMEDGTQLRLEKIVEEEVNADGWIKNHNRAGWYTTEIKDVFGNKTLVEYWRTGNFPEAIKRITVEGRPELEITTTVWALPNQGFVPGTAGMLKTLTSTGFDGSTVSYAFRYGTQEETDENGQLVNLPVLLEVDLPAYGGQPAGTIRYGYRRGITTLGHTPSYGPLLDTVEYPLGGASVYDYKPYSCGMVTRIVNEFTQATSTRQCWGVGTRRTYPDGLGATGDGVGQRFAQWGWARKFRLENFPAACEFPTGGILNEFKATAPDGTLSISRFGGHPCGEGGDGVFPAGYPIAPDGWMIDRVTYEADGTTPIRTETHTYPPPEGSPAAYFLDWYMPPETETTTYHDDEGTCFTAPNGGTGTRSMTLRRAHATTWNQWETKWLTGDYMPNELDGSGPMQWIAHVDRVEPQEMPQCWWDKHLVKLAGSSFVEEGRTSRSRYETNVELSGNATNDDGKCSGRLLELRRRRDWVAGTITDPSETLAGNQAAATGDVTATLAYTANGNLASFAYSGGDPGGNAYSGAFTWQNGQAASLQYTGLDYKSADITPSPAGRVASSRDANGLQTDYTFDSLGRLTRIDPPGTVERSMHVCYPSLNEMRVSGSALAQDPTCDHDPTDRLQAWSKQVYDGLGRTLENWKALPEGGLAFQVIRHDPAGRVIFESEWIAGDQYATVMAEGAMILWEGPDYWVRVPQKDGRPWGTVTFFGVPSISDPGDPLQAAPDALGRVRRVELADGSATDTEYCGPHKQVTVHRASAAGADPTLPDVKTRYYSDGLDRLVLVDVEPFAGQAGPYVGADAAYRHDARGNLIDVRLVENLPANPFEAWRTRDPNFPAGQERQFVFDGLGRLRAAKNPENGWTETTAYDVLGNPLVTQDALGGADGVTTTPETGRYHFKNYYDVAGRLVRVEKVAGAPGTTPPGDVSRLGGVGDFDDGGDVGAGGWELGTLDASWSTFTSGSTGWSQASYATLGCIPAPPGQSGMGLKYGAGCAYDEDGTLPAAARFLATGVTRDDVLSLSFWREVRQGGQETQDRFEVFVVEGSQGASGQTAARRSVLRLASPQASTSRWERASEVRPGDLFTMAEWPEGSPRDLWVYLVFQKGDAANSGLGRGLVVDDVALGLRGVETLAEFVFDQAVCPGAGDACTSTESATEFYRGNATRQLSYQDGRLVEAKDLVYKGLNGRLSATRSVIDLTGHGASHEWVTRWGYGATGLLSSWTAPYLSAVGDARSYGLEYDRGLLRGLGVKGGSTIDPFVGFSGSPILYDVSGALLRIPFVNQAETSVAVDKMGRPVSYTASREGEPTPYWSSGVYQFDGAGNIVGIGDQSYQYDVVGRLTEARVRNQAYTQGSGNFFVETYAFDVFGNMTAKTWTEENTAVQQPPLGAIFSHVFDPDPTANTNQIQTEGFRYDPNGNLVRFQGANEAAVGALWTAQNRMATFYTGNPEDAAATPAERYTYDSSGYRIVRFPESGDGLRVITLRDGSGQPLAEYRDDPSGAHPVHAKDFLHGAGMLLMERWQDGAAPSVMHATPVAAGGSVGLVPTSTDPVPAWAVDIRPEGGGASQVTGLVPDAEGKIWVPETSLTANTSHFLRVRRDDGEEGAYSNAVSVAYDPAVDAQSANQVRTVAVTRTGTNVLVRWGLFQENGKKLRLHFQRADGGGTVLLTPLGLNAGTTTLTVPNQALSVPCGYFYLTQQVSGSTWSGPSPAAGLPPSGSSTEFGAGQDCGQGPPPPGPSDPAWVNTFHHRDHLGSLRVVTDGGGWRVGDGHDYYPFGMEMVPAGTDTRGGSRKRFTGHERDEGSGLDYMLARYEGPSLARFISVDPLGGHADVPNTWNRYDYARNRPMTNIDPTGKATVRAYNPMDKDYVDKEQERTGGAGQGNNLGDDANQNADDAEASGERVSYKFFGVSIPGVYEAPARVVSEETTILGQKMPARGVVGGVDIGPLTNIGGKAGNILPNGQLQPDNLLAANIPIGPVRAGHIFRTALGHVKPATASSRGRFVRLFERVAADPKNARPGVLPTAAVTAGKQYFASTFRSGRQVWVEVRNGEIVDAGVNAVGATR